MRMERRNLFRTYNRMVSEFAPESLAEPETAQEQQQEGGVEEGGEPTRAQLIQQDIAEVKAQIAGLRKRKGPERARQYSATDVDVSEGAYERARTYGCKADTLADEIADAEGLLAELKQRLADESDAGVQAAREKNRATRESIRARYTKE